MITNLSSILCQKPLWMDGEVGLVANPCDAILCPKGSYSPYGRAITKDNVNCTSCPTNKYYGETVCETNGLETNREVEVLDLLFAETGGRNWNLTHTNWTKAGVPICHREGILCGYDRNANYGVTEIMLDSYGLRGKIPSEIYELTKLRRLSVSHNPVDVSFIGIEQATILEVINIANTDVNSLEGIEKAGDKLYDLHFASTGIKKSFPTEILQLVTLRKLFLEDNRITGTLPTEIGRLKNLDKLSLKQNDLTGPLPSELGLLTNLDTLDISVNSMSGVIPNELGNLLKLRSLNLASQSSFKKFTGPLPSFETNPVLLYLNVSQNALAGELPTTLLGSVDLSAHVTLDLSYNEFTGAVPIEFSNFDVLNIDLTANMISSLSLDLCNNGNWMNGVVGIVFQEEQW